MKRFTTIFFTVAMSITAVAQSIDDAVLLSENNYEGSARTMAMGNAFTALGGDIGALTINPASSGVMRSSQMSITAGFTKAGSKIDGVKDNFSNFQVPSFGYVSSFDTGRKSGLFNYNFGIALNSRSNFNSVTSIGTSTDQASYLSSIATGLSGINYNDLSTENAGSYYAYDNNNITWPEILAWNTYVLATTPDSQSDYLASTENINGTDIVIGGPLSQDYYRKRDGGITDMTLNFGGNINDELFFGVNLNISSVELDVTESYAEQSQNSAQFQDGFVRYALQYSQQTSGAGFNGQFGIIYVPKSFPGLRLGATYTTKTAYTLTDSWRYFAQSEFNNGNSYSQSSPSGNYDYLLYSPARYSIGAAYVLGTQGLISLDYEGVNYRDIIFKVFDNSTFTYKNLNSEISTQCNKAHVLRIGAEWWIEENLALRAGHNIYSAPAQLYNQRKVNSLGLGWKIDESFLFDVAYQWQSAESDFQMYDSYTGGNVPSFVAINRLSKLMCALTLKF